MLRGSALSTLLAILSLSFVDRAAAHSWLACSDYRGDVNFFEQDKCYGWPRRWQEARRNAANPIAKGYQIGLDTGYNYQPSGGQACNFPMASDSYSADFPMAVYEAGETYCLAWPTKNHAAADCTNPFIPDTKMVLFRSEANAAADPTQAGFEKNPVPTKFGKHVNGQIDCLGYQRAPKFCDDTDKAMATGCFTAPATAGTYVMQWYWEFNAGSLYTTCWDAQVVAKGAGRGKGGLTGTAAGFGTSNVCATNWAAAGANPAPDDPAAPPTTTPAPPSPTPAPNGGADGVVGGAAGASGDGTVDSSTNPRPSAPTVPGLSNAAVAMIAVACVGAVGFVSFRVHKSRTDSGAGTTINSGSKKSSKTDKSWLTPASASKDVV